MKVPKPRLQAVELQRAQRGWVATAWVSVPTQRQFTPEEGVFTNPVGEDGTPKMSHSLIVTIWRMYWHVFDCISFIQMIPGPFPENVRRTCCGKERFKV